MTHASSPLLARALASAAILGAVAAAMPAWAAPAQSFQLAQAAGTGTAGPSTPTLPASPAPAATPASPGESAAAPARPATKAPSATATATGHGGAAHAQARIARLKRELKITAAEMPEWNTLAQVMEDNQDQMETLYQRRQNETGQTTAVDDLVNYQKIADAQSDGLKKLIPAFQALYDKLSPEQKKTADTLFRPRARQTASHTAAAGTKHS